MYQQATLPTAANGARSADAVCWLSQGAGGWARWVCGAARRGAAGSPASGKQWLASSQEASESCWLASCPYHAASVTMAKQTTRKHGRQWTLEGATVNILWRGTSGRPSRSVRCRRRRRRGLLYARIAIVRRRHNRNRCLPSTAALMQQSTRHASSQSEQARKAREKKTMLPHAQASWTLADRRERSKRINVVYKPVPWLLFSTAWVSHLINAKVNIIKSTPARAI